MSKSTDPRKGRTIARATGRRTSSPASAQVYELDHAFELFYVVKQSEGMRPRTLSDYKTHWRYFREWLGDTYPDIAAINEITTTILREYVAYMTDKLSATTVAIRMRTLRTKFNFWTDERIIPSNPMRNIKPPRQDDDGMPTFTDDQLRSLLAQPNADTFAGFRDRVLMYVLADTGLRINEALRLTERHLDVKARCIYLEASLNKNRKPRIVPVSPEVMRMIFDLIHENKSYFGDVSHIFLANYGEPLKADHFRKRLRKYGEMAGIDDQVRVSPHTFRHYFCKTYLLNGGDIFTLQRIVAHASIETTRKYITMDDEDIRQQHANYSPMQRLGRSRAGKRVGRRE